MRLREKVIYELPVGAVSELREMGLSLAQYGSCAKPVQRADGSYEIVGCYVWDKCNKKECPEKGEDGEKGGPRNKGLRIIQRMTDGTTRARHVPVPCYDIPEMRDAHEGRGTKEAPVIVQVIATEGEVFMLPGTKNEDVNVPGEGIKRFARPHVYRDWTIPAFPRPKDNPSLAEEAFNSALIEDDRSKTQAEIAASLKPARKA